MTAGTDTLADTLKARGILDTATAFGWKAESYQGRSGWSYPVYNKAGQVYPQKRWKSFDGASPKYAWLPTAPEKAIYYFLPGTLSEIAAQHGQAYLASGEPDVLAYRAAGIKNVFCWFNGETSIPVNFKDHLKVMGIEVLYYAPDRDETGMKAAWKLHQLIQETEVLLILYQLPGDVGSKYDVNRLWMDSGFDADKFRQTLIAQALDPVDLFLYAGQPADTKRTAPALPLGDVIKDLRSEWQKLVTESLGPPAETHNHIARWHCPLPGHEDRHPSFRITDERTPGFGWPMCTCGIQDDKNAWDRVAEAKGLETWEQFKATQAADKGYQRSATIPVYRAPLPQMTNGAVSAAPRWVAAHDVWRDIKEEISGKRVSLIEPFKFPLNVLHEFGGYARYIWPGKVVCTGGISGGGKTLLTHYQMMNLMNRGYDVIWWGPEWSPEEYGYRDLQRAGGLDMDRIAELKIWYALRAKGIPAEEIDVPAPPESAINDSVGKLDRLLSIPGEMYFIPDADMPVGDVLALAREIATIKRSEGRKPVAFVFDYVQMATMRGERDWAWAEKVIQEIKVSCAPAGSNLAAWVNTQVKKGDSKAVRDGESLNVSSAQGLSDQRINLYLLFTPDFDSDGQIQNTATLAVMKNSTGRTGKVSIQTRFDRLTIVDKLAEPGKLYLPFDPRTSKGVQGIDND